MNANEFLPANERLKAELLEQWQWENHPLTIASVGSKTYAAKEGRAAERKMTVTFVELTSDWPLECNLTQVRSLIELFGQDTDQWHGHQVLLLSVPTKTPQGTDAKTILIKGVVTARPATPAAPTAPASAASAAPEAAEEERDPFADEAYLEGKKAPAAPKPPVK